MKQTDPKIDFGARLKELEAITLWFESDEVDLDQALVKFERGMALAAELKAYLATVENRVEKIKSKFNTSAKNISEIPAEPEQRDELPVEPDLFS